MTADITTAEQTRLREIISDATMALALTAPRLQCGIAIRTDNGTITLTGDEVRQHPELMHAIESALQYRIFRAERALDASRSEVA